MPVRVCDRCVRFLVGARPGAHDAQCPYCESALRPADSQELQEFIERLRRPDEESPSHPPTGSEVDRSR